MPQPNRKSYLWRTTLIPAMTIPISLIATFAFTLAIGQVINLISQ